MNTRNLVNGYESAHLPDKEIFLEDIGGMITSYRKSRLMTQTELGELMGLKKAQICKIEKGENLTMSTISRVFSAMGINAQFKVEPAIEESELHNFLDDVVMTVSEFADTHKLSSSQAFKYLDDFGGIEYLMLFWNAVKCESLQNTIEDLTHLCRKNGGRL